MVRCTGCVVAPYLWYPTIIPLLVNIMRTEVDVSSRSITVGPALSQNASSSSNTQSSSGSNLNSLQRQTAGSVKHLGAGTANSNKHVDAAVATGRSNASSFRGLAVEGEEDEDEEWELKKAAYRAYAVRTRGLWSCFCGLACLLTVCVHMYVCYWHLQALGAVDLAALRLSQSNTTNTHVDSRFGFMFMLRH